MKPATLKGAALGAAAMFAFLCIVALIVVLTGAFNVAATDRHNPVVGWALSTTMENSVAGRADGVIAPAAFSPTLIERGAGEYKAMCAHCHGGVGESRAGWAQTMRPKPPALAHAAARWSVEEIYWIVEHGVKMSGMPAFGPTHDAETLWAIAAFVEQLPNMSAEEYAAAGGGGADEGHTHGEGGHH